MTGKPYLASQDSALLRRALQVHSAGSFLEMGAGNGGNLVDMVKRSRLVVGTDIVMPAMSDWKEAGASFLLADRGSCLRDSCFDLVAFNPPYLPADPAEDTAVGGGRGLEVPESFLREALRVVKKSGTVVFLLNDEANEEKMKKICAERGFRLERKASQRVFFEELRVYSATAGS